MYQLANVYLLLLAGSLFDSLNDALSDPASVLRLISSALPSVAVFFMNFILTAWLAGLSITLLRPVAPLKLAWLRLRNSCRGGTDVEGPAVSLGGGAAVGGDDDDDNRRRAALFADEPASPCDSLRLTRRQLVSPAAGGPLAPFEIDYGALLPNALYIMCIALLYWVIAPMVLPFAAGFFFCAELLYRCAHIPTLTTFLCV